MNIEYLRYFLVVSHSRSINQAAGQLFISQQHLNHILTDMENELSTTLLTRTKAGITLTNNGKKFASYAEKICNLYDEVRNSFKGQIVAIEGDAKLFGSCKLYITPFISLYLSDFVNRFYQLFPQISLSIEEYDSYHGYADQLKNDGLSIIVDVPELYSDESPRKRNHFSYLIDVQMIYCMRPSLFPQNKTWVNNDDLFTLTHTLYPEHNMQLYNVRTSLFTSSNPYQHMDSVLQNGSVCTIPSYAVPKLHKMYPEVRMLPLQIAANMVYTCQAFLVYSKTYNLSPADKAVMRFAKIYLQELALQADQILKTT